MENSKDGNKQIQRRLNPETLKLLEKKGADLRKRHEIINVFNLFDYKAIENLSRLLENAEFKIIGVTKMDDSIDSVYWSLDAMVDQIPDIDNINQTTDLCVDLVATVDAADYDGWYTQPVD